MPIKTIAYRCKWKCNRKVLRNKQQMEKHESICFFNPSRRACQTCLHYIKDTEDYGDGRGSFKITYCDCELFDAKSENKRRVDCSYWKSKK